MTPDLLAWLFGISGVAAFLLTVGLVFPHVVVWRQTGERGD